MNEFVAVIRDLCKQIESKAVCKDTTKVSTVDLIAYENMQNRNLKRSSCQLQEYF